MHRGHTRLAPLFALAPGLGFCLAFALGCVSPPPPIDMIDAEEVTLEEGEGIRVQQAVILFDVSRSMEQRSHRFESSQNIASSFAMGMPEGDYEVAVVSFGGRETVVSEFEPFDRDTVDSALFDAELSSYSTDIPEALAEAARLLDGRTGATAIVLFSDGVAQRYGRPLGPAGSIAAAQRLVENVDGEICYYAVQAGNDPAGTALLEGIVSTTPCGARRNLSAIADSQSLREFQEAMFVEELAPDVAAAPPVVFLDEDGDGVEDGRDDCPGTPTMANVNERGCWVLDQYTFAVKEYEIQPSQYPALDGVAEVLKLNPELRIRIDGHTDSSGTAAFNQTLSEQRAEAVRDYLEEAGIDANRLETRGFGMSAPVADNDTPEGMASNRRCQLTILR